MRAAQALALRRLTCTLILLLAGLGSLARGLNSRVGVTLRPLFRIVRWMQGLLLTTYLKFLIADPEDASLRSLAEEVFDRYSR